MPDVKPPRREPLELEVESLKKELRVMSGRIETFRREWPEIHAKYFTLAGEKKRLADTNQPRRKRTK